jgi:hypothetical protein
MAPTEKNGVITTGVISATVQPLPQLLLPPATTSAAAATIAAASQEDKAAEKSSSNKRRSKKCSCCDVVRGLSVTKQTGPLA